MTQDEAFDILKLGHNVYLTGAAGSGKTYLLNKYIDYLQSHKIPVGITASTGIAATHMGGTTIHSWVGMGIRDSMSDSEIAELFKKQYLKKRFAKTHVLIIDEISMLHAKRLDLVHAICKAFRKIDYPFGGMQVIMCGDFFQLPPIAKGEEKGDFVVASEIWENMRVKVCYLDEQFRQSDRSFLRVLNAIRQNAMDEDTFGSLSERMHADIKGYAKPTKLYTHNIDVDKINDEQLQMLSEKSFEYDMASRGAPALAESLKKSCLAPEKLVLKKGAQVMFVKNNYEAGFVNGTLGEVIGFTKENAPIVRTFDGSEITVGYASWEVKEGDIEIAAIAQMPLRLAWAITIHKSQGMSLDAAEIDLSRSFIPGMGYVALSRVRSLQGLRLLGINQMALKVNDDVAAMDADFLIDSNEVVRYLHDMAPDKKNKMQRDFLEYLTGGNKNTPVKTKNRTVD